MREIKTCLYVDEKQIIKRSCLCLHITQGLCMGCLKATHYFQMFFHDSLYALLCIPYTVIFSSPFYIDAVLICFWAFFFFFFYF